MRAFKLQFAALIVWFLASCTDESQLSMVVDIDPMQWREAAQFSIPNNDVTSEREISVFVRYQPSYEQVDSLALHVVTIAPDEARVVEQLTIHFDNSLKQQWRRRLYQEVSYRRGVKFNQRGEYKVMIYPQGSAIGVEAVGLIIE